MTRELDLFNPFGIEHSPGIVWVGQADDQPDPTFVKFVDFPHGVRAAVRVLRTYTAEYGITTVGAAISKWSPPQENDTLSYIDDVCARCQCEASAPFLPILPLFLRALADHENGVAAAAVLTDAEIAEGIALT
jgi:hypothetical protein